VIFLSHSGPAIAVGYSSCLNVSIRVTLFCKILTSQSLRHPIAVTTLETHCTLDTLVSRYVRKFPVSFPQSKSKPMLYGSLRRIFFSSCVHIIRTNAGDSRSDFCWLCKECSFSVLVYTDLQAHWLVSL